jgi:hypothetical protein
MATTVVNLDVVKSSVLTELEDKALRPTELLAILGKDYPDSLVKEAVLRLLQDQLIRMTADQRLEAAEAA